MLASLLNLGCDKRRETVLECGSPDSAYTARYYIEFGGGAAGWSYEYVSVRRNDNNAERVVLKLKGSQDVSFRWVSNLWLEIAYPDNARVDHWENVFDWRRYSERLGSPKSSLREVAADEYGRFIHEKSQCVR